MSEIKILKSDKIPNDQELSKEIFEKIVKGDLNNNNYELENCIKDFKANYKKFECFKYSIRG